MISLPNPRLATIYALDWSLLIFASVKVSFDDSLIVIAFIRPDGFQVLFSLIGKHHRVVRIFQVICAFAEYNDRSLNLPCTTH